MSENGPTAEQMGIAPDSINSIVEHSNFVRIDDVKQATEYASHAISPEEYYASRWNETIKFSDELFEDEKIQWSKPQLLLLGGLPRSGKSTVATTIEREYTKEGIPCVYFGSDVIRNDLKKEIETQMLEEGYAVGTEVFANEREKRLYSDENRQRVYNALYNEAGKFMRETSGIAIVDATHITDDKREKAYNAIMNAYTPDEEHKTPDYKYIEVSNSLEDALDIFSKDQERIDQARKGFKIGKHDEMHFQKPADLPYDVSEAHPDIRKRDEALYEPITNKHIKVINNFDTAEQLIAHVRNDLMATKPDNITSLWDTE